MRILVVEDDRKAARLVSKGLEEAGFLVDIAYSAEDGERRLKAVSYDVMVLDWLLPGTDGAAFCRDLRARAVSTRILMLTAKGSLEDRVAGLKAGADDYLTKPFAFAELLARLEALLRRSPLPRADVLKVGDLTLDLARHEVTRAGVRLKLTPREFAILETLMRRPGELLTRSALADRICGGLDDSNLVDVHVCHLRKKIDQPPRDSLIQTVWGSGYRLGMPR